MTDLVIGLLSGGIGALLGSAVSYLSHRDALCRQVLEKRFSALMEINRSVRSSYDAMHTMCTSFANAIVYDKTDFDILFNDLMDVSGEVRDHRNTALDLCDVHGWSELANWIRAADPAWQHAAARIADYCGMCRYEISLHRGDVDRTYESQAFRHRQHHVIVIGGAYLSHLKMVHPTILSMLKDIEAKVSDSQWLIKVPRTFDTPKTIGQSR